MEKSVNVVRIITMISILALAIYVALFPNAVYAPVPRVVLFLLIALLPAILLGAEGATRLKLALPGLVLTATGAAAILFGLLLLLNHLAKPQEQIAVYEVFDEKGEAVSLEGDGVVDVSPSERGLAINKFVRGNTIILIFPEQVAQAEMRVKTSRSAPVYSGQVSYAGSRTLKLKLGTDLKSNQ